MSKTLVLTAACVALSLGGCREDEASPMAPTPAVSPIAGSAPAPRGPTTRASELREIVGSVGDDTLYGSTGDDMIEGLGGDDEITGGPGSDVIHGGDGNDLIMGDGALPAMLTGRVEGEGPFLVVDQFGYRPDMQKIAVLRNPEGGFDADDLLEPEFAYQVVDAATDEVVLVLGVEAWADGAVHDGSGDMAWWVDFSALTTPGTYRIEDAVGVVVSPEFRIANDVYADVLATAQKTFFYQRAGFAKEQPFAAPGFEDGPSHMGPGQDTEARRYDAPGDASTARDLHGGWYDAGDYNKYTNWTADYVISLLTSYRENPDAFTDDIGIPESNNGVPDILDEVLWGTDWLVRMQNADGSVLSIVGLASGSPPSAATGPSYYGPASTSATLTTAGAFALASIVYAELDGDPAHDAYAADMLLRAEAAWAWADANPSVVFLNNDAATGSQGLGAGQQEVDNRVRAEKKLSAAIYLFAATGKSVYGNYVRANYTSSRLVGNFYINGFEGTSQRDLLFYAALPNADPQAAATIRDRYRNAMENPEHWGNIDNAVDPYRAHLNVYTWGSNNIKSREGILFLQQSMYGIGSRTPEAARNAAAGYLHYLHGVNPFGLVYLSNMAGDGAERSVDTFYHTWFADGSPLWDSVSGSTYGPAPGFVVGGPNPSYSWDGCCPASCGGAGNNARCGTAPLSPPTGQPPQKAYREFNESWPLNSWSITENSNGYQVSYIRLLSKYVD